MPADARASSQQAAAQDREKNGHAQAAPAFGGTQLGDALRGSLEDSSGSVCGLRRQR